jgi:hypothetical protein
VLHVIVSVDHLHQALRRRADLLKGRPRCGDVDDPVLRRKHHEHRGLPARERLLRRKMNRHHHRKQSFDLIARRPVKRVIGIARVEVMLRAVDPASDRAPPRPVDDRCQRICGSEVRRDQHPGDDLLRLRLLCQPDGQRGPGGHTDHEHALARPPAGLQRLQRIGLPRGHATFGHRRSASAMTREPGAEQVAS